MSETMSSSSTMTSSIVETSVPKTMLGTIVKLNGSNYLLWALTFIFIGTQNKLAHLLEPPPVDMNLTYVIWLTGYYSVPTAQDIWDTLKVMYDNEKNLLRVFEIYESLFELKKGDRSVSEFYREFKVLIDELEMHQPSVIEQRH